MRIFRKPCVSVSDVASPANDKKFTLAKRQDMGFDETQYEYVRREYGYDYVPPSQYVPSRSPDPEDDSESDEVDNGGGNNRTVAAPVKILAPPSDLSGSMDDGGDIFVPKQREVLDRTNAQYDDGNDRYGRKNHTPATYPKRRPETKPYHPTSSAIMEEEEGAVPIHRTLRHQHPEYQHRQPLPVGREQPAVERHERIQSATERHERKQSAVERQNHRHRNSEQRQQYEQQQEPPHEKPSRRCHTPISDRRPVEEDHDAYRSDRHRRSVEVKSDRPRDRPSHPTSYNRTARGSREDEVIFDDDDVAIGEVQTAYSYNSNDSAEVLIYEKSKGSRYTNSTRNNSGATLQRKERHRVSKNYKSRGEEYVSGEGSRSNHILEEQFREKSLKGNFEDFDQNQCTSMQYSENDKTEPRRNTSNLGDFDKPRYDRKKQLTSELKQTQDEMVHRGRTYQGQTQDAYRDHHSVESHARKTDPQLHNRHEKIHRHVPEKQTHNVPRERDDYVQRRGNQTEVHRQHRGPASYYSTPSGEVASDYDFSERNSPRSTSLRHSSIPDTKMRGSKGFLGRIRDSVRGQKKPSKGLPVAPVENSYCDEDNENSSELSYVGRPPSKTSGLFEQIQPSVRSDVSPFENRRVSNLYGEERSSPLPSSDEIMSCSRRESLQRSLPNHKRHDHRHDRHDVLRNSRGAADLPVVEEMTIQRLQRHRSEFSDYYVDDRRRYEDDLEEAYWESASVECSDHSTKQNISKPLNHTAIAVPFQSIRTETPILRSNPDLRQRHLPVPHAMSRHYSHGYLSPDHHQSKHAAPNAMGTDSRISTHKPVKTLRIPIKSSETIRGGKQNVMDRTTNNNKGFKIGCY
jgi:hypothetical protein